MTEVSGWSCGARFEGCRKSRRLVIIVVSTALLLDSMLLATIVPIIPEFLYNIRHREPDEGIRFEAAKLSTTETPFVTSIPANMDAAMTTKAPRRLKHDELVDETYEIGFMLASKVVVQLLANPFVGPLTNRIGYSIPMFTGLVIIFVSSTIFAYGRSFSVLFLARALHGIASSCLSVAGMGMVAERYPGDKERGNAMAVALGGLALGVLVGPPFGGLMYQFVGKREPFLYLAALALGVGFLQLLVVQPEIVRRSLEAPSLIALLTDPYIMVAAGAIAFVNMGITMLEPSLPIHMMDTLNAPKWLPNWEIPLATSFNQLIAPNVGIGFAIGMVVSSMMPELGRLVDIRHTGEVYGSVYAIGDVAFNLGFAIGPILSGILVKNIGFEWMLVAIAIISLAYAPALFLLRAPPTHQRGPVENLL
ncbi:Synaptic vesicular amine transporter [Folsomia candida]|uniref:Synaptic vesicular amine transporter n=1 Tax=Folsomia candida TaxID=158441 RepID=A0A226DQ30_FOLCA|nr:Synaptic vesicular amine transporter [Folsomia candida]